MCGGVLLGTGQGVVGHDLMGSNWSVLGFTASISQSRKARILGPVWRAFGSDFFGGSRWSGSIMLHVRRWSCNFARK
jgi:hypothetical protein